MDAYIKSLLGEVSEEYLTNFRKVIKFLVWADSNNTALVDWMVPLKHNLVIYIWGPASTGKSTFVKILRHYCPNCVQHGNLIESMKKDMRECFTENYISCNDQKFLFKMLTTERSGETIMQSGLVLDPKELPLKKFITVHNHLPATSEYQEMIVPICFENKFESGNGQDPNFIEKFTTKITKEEFHEYFDILVDSTEIDGLKEYFQKQNVM